MKKFLLLFSFFVGVLAMAQMPDISNVFLNKNKSYSGKLLEADQNLLVTISNATQSKTNDQEYFVSGTTKAGNVVKPFEGKITITKYKDGKKRSTVYGEYDFAEAGADEHSGELKGKFIFTFKWNDKLEKVEDQFIQFTGKWTNYKKTLQYRTLWDNQ